MCSKCSYYYFADNALALVYDGPISTTTYYASVLLPTFKIAEKGNCFTFKALLYKTQTARISLKRRLGALQQETIWEHRGSQGASWIKMKVTIRSDPAVDETSQINIDMSHNGDNTDLIAAIDDITLYEEECNSVGKEYSTLSPP